MRRRVDRSSPSTFHLDSAGKELDEELGWYYLGARYLDPAVGRFFVPDPAGLTLENPQSYNRYTYALNNPYKFDDPDGRLADILLDVGFIAYDIYDIGRSVVRGEGVSGVQAGALGADVLGAAIPFATGLGAAVRAGTKADNIARGARAANNVRRGGAAPVRVGQAGEAAVRAVFDIGKKIPIKINGRGRIPDGLTKQVLTEIKNVKSLSFTRQLRDFVDFAQENRLRFDLFVRPGTHLSGPLSEAVEQGLIKLHFIP